MSIIVIVRLFIAMSKYYAVKVGKVPGIYMSWPECQAQTKGFSGAIFKSFPNREEAAKYIWGERVPMEVTSTINRDSNNNSNNTGGGLIARSHVVGPGVGIKLHSPEEAIVLNNNINSNNSDISVTDAVKEGMTKKVEYDPQNPLANYEHVMLNSLKELYTADKRLLDTEPQTTIIFIDGSKHKKGGIPHRGSGAYCRFNSKDYHLSVPCTREVLQRYNILESDYDNMSSPTMEFMAFSETLYRFINFTRQNNSSNNNNNDNERVTPRINLCFFADYLGVKSWIDGSWTPSKDYITKIRDICWIIIHELKKRGVDIFVYHIHGHVKIFGNELSDVNAKSTVYKDDFGNLVKDMSTYFSQ